MARSAFERALRVVAVSGAVLVDALQQLYREVLSEHAGVDRRAVALAADERLSGAS